MKRFLAVAALLLGFAVPQTAQAQASSESFFYQGCVELGCVNLTASASLTFGNPPWLAFAENPQDIWYYEGWWSLGRTGFDGLSYRINSYTPGGTGENFFSITLAESFPEVAAGRATFATDFTPAPSIVANITTCDHPIGGRTCGPTAITYIIPMNLISVTTTPEPATLPLIGFGLLALAATARRRLV